METYWGFREVFPAISRRAVLPFECSALVRVREPSHFRASR